MISNLDPHAKMEMWLTTKKNIFKMLEKRKRKYGIVYKPKFIKKLLQRQFTQIMRYDK